MERKLATIRKIEEVKPIDGADMIEACRVGGWWVVAKKDEFKVGDLAVYCEVDCWIPHELAPFLSKGKEPREFEGIKGERLRSIRLKGQLSQGLLLPIDLKDGQFTGGIYVVKGEPVEEGQDVTELLGIVKWERPISPQLAGKVKGNFPSSVPKTDQERCQNLQKELDVALKAGTDFEISEKLDGSSMTVYLIDGVFGVCSRNLDLERDENNSMWKLAIRLDLEEKIRNSSHGHNIALQGEIVGPGIQGNKYDLKDHEFFIFDIFNASLQEYLVPENRRLYCELMELKHVPVIEKNRTLEEFSVPYSDHVEIDRVLTKADQMSKLNPNAMQEGEVYKANDGGFTFKAISNAWLLGNKE